MTLRPLLNITIQKHHCIANYISRIYLKWALLIANNKIFKSVSKICKLTWDLNSVRYDLSQTTDLNNCSTRYRSATALTPLCCLQFSMYLAVRAVGVATLNAFSVKKQRINAKSERSKCCGLAIGGDKFSRWLEWNYEGAGRFSSNIEDTFAYGSYSSKDSQGFVRNSQAFVTICRATLISVIVPANRIIFWRICHKYQMFIFARIFATVREKHQRSGGHIRCIHPSGTQSGFHAPLTQWRIYGECAYECNSPPVRNYTKWAADINVIRKHSRSFMRCCEY